MFLDRRRMRLGCLVLVGALLALSAAAGGVSAQTYGPGNEFLLVPGSAAAGGTIIGEGNACGANMLITFFIDGEPVGSTTTNDDPDGFFHADIMIPVGTDPGDVVVIAQCPDGRELRATAQVTPATLPFPDADPTAVTPELAFSGSSRTWPLTQIGVGLLAVGVLVVAYARRTGTSKFPAGTQDPASV